MRQHPFSVVVLAAGESRRFGRPKQAALLEGEMLLDRAVRVANEAGAAEVLVVLGAFAEQIRATCKLDHSRVVVNPVWKEGMSSSIRAGVSALRQTIGVVIMTCDMPDLMPGDLRRLTEKDRVAAAQHVDGSLGVPAYFPYEFFADLQSVSGSGGAKELLAKALAVSLGNAVLDIDTEQDLSRISSARGRSKVVVRSELE